MYHCYSPSRDIACSDICVVTTSQWEADFFASLGYTVFDYSYLLRAE